jgi:hypothetical protein
MIGIAAFVSSVLCAIALTFVVFQMVDNVNEKLPEERQFSHLGWYWSKYGRLLAEYRRLYPESSLLRRFRILSMVLFVCFFVSAWGLGMFAPWERLRYGPESTEQCCDAYTLYLGEHTLCVGKLVDSPPTNPERDTCDHKKNQATPLKRDFKADLFGSDIDEGFANGDEYIFITAYERQQHTPILDVRLRLKSNRIDSRKDWRGSPFRGYATQNQHQSSRRAMDLWGNAPAISRSGSVP